MFRADISSVDGFYTQSSDRRLKKDIKNMNSVLTKAGNLKPSTDYMIDDIKKSGRSVGFIAQEVELLFPELVREADEGFMGLVYDGVAVIAIKAIQKQKTQIDALNAENKELKKEIQEIKTIIEKK